MYLQIGICDCARITNGLPLVSVGAVNVLTDIYYLSNMLDPPKSIAINIIKHTI